MGLLDDIKSYLRGIRDSVKDSVYSARNAIQNTVRDTQNYISERLQSVEDNTRGTIERIGNETIERTAELIEPVKDRITTFSNDLVQRIGNQYGSTIWWFENLNGRLDELKNTYSTVANDITGDIIRNSTSLGENIIEKTVSMTIATGESIKNLTAEQAETLKLAFTDTFEALQYDIQNTSEELDKTRQAITEQITMKFNEMNDNFAEIMTDFAEKVDFDNIIASLTEILDLMRFFVETSGATLEFLYENREQLANIMKRIAQAIGDVVSFLMAHPNLFYTSLFVIIAMMMRISFMFFKIFVLGRVAIL